MSECVKSHAGRRLALEVPVLRLNCRCSRKGDLCWDILPVLEFERREDERRCVARTFTGVFIGDGRAGGENCGDDREGEGELRW